MANSNPTSSNPVAEEAPAHIEKPAQSSQDKLEGPLDVDEDTLDATVYLKGLKLHAITVACVISCVEAQSNNVLNNVFFTGLPLPCFLPILRFLSSQRL
jgi:hypothetical protein